MMKQSMKKTRKMFVALIAALAMVVSVSLCACSPTSDQPAASSSSSSAAASSSASSSAAAVDQYAVTVTVTSPEGPDAIDFSQQIPVAAGATVLDALEATELEVTIEEGPYGAFVAAIDNIANEGTSGWTYTVNGEQVQVSAGEAPVNAGDTIAWSYIDMAE